MPSECGTKRARHEKAKESGSEARKPLEISLERSYGRMKIWSDENGAADGTLDAKLEASHDLQLDTLRYLVSISQTLTDRLVDILDVDLGHAGYESRSRLGSLIAAVIKDDSETSSDSGFSDTSVVSVSGILEDLRVDTTCLMDLEPLLCSPIIRTKSEPQPPSDFGNLDPNIVAEALEIAKDSPDGARDPVVSGILESALTQLWDRVTAEPESYLMSTGEFAVFNFYQHRFVGNKLAVAARRRFWDSIHA